MAEIQCRPTDFLWDYEVVEASFRNSQNDTYLEVEYSPHGHYIVLLLQGRRNPTETLLPLKYSTTLCADTGSWQGQANIPLDYFPPKVDKFNAFAIHGSGFNRQYEQLYHQMELSAQPDFHRQEDFKPIEFSAIIPSNMCRSYSPMWTAKMK
ncbi:UPF0462 protein C4orf33 homolog [Watersipora subatra]|uniref:UPF0462 protein C4orf33 homolog n=1 Tax=Watersipora subatra TaxID=2589382 RepID=UPI00355B9EAE